MEKKIKTNFDSLRQKAEELLKNNLGNSTSEAVESDLLKLIHELDVYKIELEMQNEELIIAKAESENLARFLEENTNPVIRVSIEGALMYRNRAAEKIIHSEALTYNCSVIDVLKNKSYEAYNSNENTSMEIESSESCYLFDFIPITDRGYVNIYGENITIRKQAEKDLTASEEKFFKIFQKSPVLMAISNISDGEIIDVNEKFIEVSGFSKEECIDKTIMDIGLIDKYTRAKMLKIFQEKGYVDRFEIEVTNKNNEKVICLFFGEAIVVENKTCFLALALDISDHKRMEEELKLLNSEIWDIALQMENIRDEERTHLSREMHDGLGPLLSSIKLYFQWLSETDDDKKIKLITEKGNQNIDLAIQTTREISRGLNSGFLNESGYVDASLNFVESLNETGKLKINFSYNSKKRFGYLSEITLYRITTEIINNTLKHSGASDLEMNFNYQNDKKIVSLSCIDNGKGFDLEEMNKEKKGMGLLNIEQRIKNVKGKLSIKTAVGAGSRYENIN